VCPTRARGLQRAAMKVVAMKVHVDPARCRGHALCLGRAPEAFDFLDLEDRAVVKDGAVGTVPDDVFRAAARECPERAIVVELDEDGGAQA
jgi:ferredoxin